MFPKRFTTAGAIIAYAPPSLCAIDGDGSEGGGGSPAAPEAPQISNIQDQHSAADFLASSGLLGELLGEVADDDAQNSGEQPEDGAGENPPTGEEEGQSEAEGQETPTPIEPPKSWADEHKELFSKLPPEAQKVIAHRETEREAAFTRGQQEVAEQRKAVEAERAATQERTAQYHQNLQQLVALALPEAKAFEGVDWAKLATENPAEYVRLSGMRDGLSRRIGAIQAEIQRVSQQHAAETQKRVETYMSEQRKLLAERVPDFADPVKGKALAGEIGEFLKAQGFNADEIGNVTDHRAVAMATKLMRYEKAEATRKAAEAKQAAATNPPRVQRPGTPQDTRDALSQRQRNEIGQFRRTGSVQDASRILEHIL